MMQGIRESRSVRANGYSAHYEVSGAAGSKNVFVWLHGMSNSVDQTRESRPELAFLERPDCTIIRLDARGHGRSEAVGSPRAFQWRSLARDLEAVLRKLGLPKKDGRLILGGESMGVGTIMNLLANSPHWAAMIDALVLIRPPSIYEARKQRLHKFAAQTKKSPRGAASPKIYKNLFKGAGMSDFPAKDLIENIQSKPPALILGWDGDDIHPGSSCKFLGEHFQGDTKTPEVRSLYQMAGRQEAMNIWPNLVDAFLERVLISDQSERVNARLAAFTKHLTEEQTVGVTCIGAF